MTKRQPYPTRNPDDSRPGFVAVFLLALAAGNVNGQTAPTVDTSAGAKPSFSIIPRVSISETWTDNVRLSTNDRQSELITVLSPGIRVSADRGKLKGYFDYAINTRYFAQNSSGTDAQNALTAFGTLEAVENWAFVDLSAGISQQSISALGTPSAGSTAISSNQNETSTIRLSPYLRGKLADAVDYEARYSLTANRNKSSAASDATTRDGSIRLGGRGSGARLGWSLVAQQQNTAYSTGRSTESDLFTGGLSYAIVPQLSVSISVGQDANNFTTADKQSSETYGYGISWIPSETTSFSASRENRRFGEAFSVSATHRTARTAWRFTDSKSIATPTAQNGLVTLGSAFDIFFDQFASAEPDPVKRAALVNSFLQANGIDPSTSVTTSFATSAVSVLRRQDLSFSLLGIRDTVTFIATRSESSRVDTLSSAVDDLSNGAVIRQSGFSVSVAHRLTPNSSLSVLASTSQSSDSLGLQDSSNRSVNLSFSTKLGLKTTAAISARHVVFESNTNPYTESAITGTVNVQF
jgi:uncharacterized protein (PEP-CTERM system associated)